MWNRRAVDKIVKISSPPSLLFLTTTGVAAGAVVAPVNSLFHLKTLRRPNPAREYSAMQGGEAGTRVFAPSGGGSVSRPNYRQVGAERPGLLLREKLRFGTGPAHGCLPWGGHAWTLRARVSVLEGRWWPECLMMGRTPDQFVP